MRGVASGGSNKLRRSGAPPCGVAAHPLGVLLAASIPFCLAVLCDPQGRAPDAAPSRRAPLALLMASPPASSAGRGGQQKTQRVRLARVGRAAPPPAPHPLGVLLAVFTPIQAAPVGCLTGRLYPSFGLPTPAEWTHSVSCWQPLPQTGCDPKKYLRPTGSLGPAAPPPAGSDTRRCSCLRAGRLTPICWEFCQQPLPSDSKSRRPAALPRRRAEISHRSIGRSAGCEPKTSSEAVARGNFISLCSSKDERNSSLCGRATGRQ